MELVLIVRDQEVDGSNPFAPTIFLLQFHMGNSFVGASACAINSSLCPVLCSPNLPPRSQSLDLADISAIALELAGQKITRSRPFGHFDIFDVLNSFNAV